MKALIYNGKLGVKECSRPIPGPEEARLRVRLAGICNTDLEIVRGYLGYSGILGHEFVGELVEAAGSFLPGQRVVGEINCACRSCDFCRRGLGRHCRNRTTIGIDRRPGIIAEFTTLPIVNLHPVPNGVSDEEAVFAEPLAAACEILEQVPIEPQSQIAIVGDGKLGLLIAQVMRLTGGRVVLVSKHPNRLGLIPLAGVQVLESSRLDRRLDRTFDLVVEATGNPSGLESSLNLVRPRGTVVLKSTFSGDVTVDTSRIVVDEIQLIGSRCGPFPAALRLLEQGLVSVLPLISDRFRLEDALRAFKRAEDPDSLKVLIQTTDDRKP